MFCRQMYGLVGGGMYGWVIKWTEGWVDLADRWIDRLMDGRTDGWVLIERRTDGWVLIERQTDGWVY